MEWVQKIHDKWSFVNVVTCIGSDSSTGCIGWTAGEVQLLYETMSEYILGDSIDDGTLTFVRTDSDDYAGLHTGSVDSKGIKHSEIRLSNGAWTTPPALGIQDSFEIGLPFKKTDYFKGTIAHELTHTAVFNNPKIYDNYESALSSTLSGTDIWISRTFTGKYYDWSIYDKYKNDPLLYERLIEGEWLAMAVSASMYDGWFGAFR
jgi:hypothetical protein